MPELKRTPPYLQVARDLRQKITEGELADGDRLPSVRQLADTYSIAQATAMKVLAALRADGLAESIVGVGTVVRRRTGALEAVAARLGIDPADLRAALEEEGLLLHDL